MKIVQIVCTFPPYKGGMGNVALGYAEIIAKSGHLSTILTPEYTRGSGSVSGFFVLKRLKPLVSYGNAALLLQIISYLKKSDIVHFHYPFFGTDIILWLATLVGRKNFKLIIHYHMAVKGLPFFLRPLSWPSKIIFKSLIKKADLVICSSLDYVANSQIKSVYKKYKNKFKEIEFGVDIKRFFPLPKEKMLNNRILFVGGLDSAHYFKGLNFFFESLKNLENEEWSLEIVGSGDLEGEYKARVKDLKLETRVKFLGNVSSENLSAIYREVNLLVLPSINSNEAFGLVLLEAMASGVAVLSSDLPGVRKVFKDGIQGLYFKTNDKNDLEQKLKWLLSNKNKVLKMGQQGRNLSEEKYSQKIVAKKLLKMYENLHNK